jgi:hypothetical protein
MKGGTIFYFVTDGIKSVLEDSKRAADGKIYMSLAGLQQFVNFCKQEILMK